MEYTTNAPKGAALLDERMPGWADRIDLATLGMASMGRCVLGQLYGGYATGIETLFPDHVLSISPDHPAHVYGFDLRDPSRAAWQALTDAWTALVDERQTASTLRDNEEFERARRVEA